jgi:hypothetical protein
MTQEQLTDWIIQTYLRPAPPPAPQPSPCEPGFMLRRQCA